jgi:hypothetical protein
LGQHGVAALYTHISDGSVRANRKLKADQAFNVRVTKEHGILRIDLGYDFAVRVSGGLGAAEARQQKPQREEREQQTEAVPG